MTKIFSDLILLLIVLIIAAVALLLILPRQRKSRVLTGLSGQVDASAAAAGRISVSEGSRGTKIMTRYSVAVTDAGGAIGTFPVPDKPERFSIGCAEHDDIRVNDETVSHEHLLIGYDEKGLFLKDNGSTNGTRLEQRGERIERDIDLAEGLSVYLGRDTRLVFHDSYAAPVEHRVRRTADDAAGM